MKSLFCFLLVTTAFAVNASEIDIAKISGPECTAYIKEEFELTAEKSYQICSSSSEETKVCLIENSKLAKSKLIEKCHAK